MILKYKSVYATHRLKDRSGWSYAHHVHDLPVQSKVLWGIRFISYNLIEDMMPVSFLWVVMIQDIQKIKFQKSS